MFSTKLVKTPVPTTAPRSADESARTMASPVARPIRNVAAARVLFENRFMSSSPKALLLDRGERCRGDVDPALDAPAVRSLHIEIFVVAAVVAQVCEPTHTLRRRSQSQAGCAEDIWALVDATGSIVRFVFVGAVQILVVTVIVARELPDLDEVSRRQTCGDLLVGHDIAGLESPPFRRLHIDIVVVATAAAVDDPRRRAFRSPLDDGRR